MVGYGYYLIFFCRFVNWSFVGGFENGELYYISLGFYVRFVVFGDVFW